MPRACARSMICDEVALAARSTGRPRRPSLPPSATISTRTSPSSAQSSRAQAAGRRVAGHAGVDDLVVEPVAVETLLQQRRIRLRRRQTEAGGQAVAEHDDARRASRRRRRGAGAAAGVAGRTALVATVAGATPHAIAARKRRDRESPAELAARASCI